jgi:hypothetical protein
MKIKKKKTKGIKKTSLESKDSQNPQGYLFLFVFQEIPLLHHDQLFYHIYYNKHLVFHFLLLLQ